MKTQLNPCPALKPFVDYWDDWHLKWFANVKKSTPNVNPIVDCWESPTPIWRFFPEPYWGNPYNDNLVAVFLNINPGEGDVDQDIFHLPINDPNSTYIAQHNIYSRTVEILSTNNKYETTKYFTSNRINWLRKLFECMKIQQIPNLSVQNIITVDLIPWHTPTVDSFVLNYIKKHHNCILKNVIEPITAISQCMSFKGLVFAKGAEIEHFFERMKCQNILYENGKNRIRIFNYNGAKIIVFVGGQGMRLPNPCKEYEHSGDGTKLSIADIVKKYKH